MYALNSQPPFANGAPRLRPPRIAELAWPQDADHVAEIDRPRRHRRCGGRGVLVIATTAGAYFKLKTIQRQASYASSVG